MIGQNTHSRNIFSVHGFLNLSVRNPSIPRCAECGCAVTIEGTVFTRLSYAVDGKLAFNLVNKLNRSVK